MDKTLRILHLEDEPDYSDLVRSLFEKEGLEIELIRAGNATEFASLLEKEDFDVILADYLLPDSNGIDALRLAQEKRPDTPFLLVSGTMREEAAIEGLKAGATDYVLKLRPERLVPAVWRAVLEAKKGEKLRQIETELIQREKEYRLIFDGNPTPMWVFDQETLAFLEVNDAAVQHYGYSREEFLAMKLTDMHPPEDGPALIEYLQGASSRRMGLAGVWRHRKKDGTLLDVEMKWSPIQFRGQPASLTMINDITERKRIEHRDAALSKLGQNLSSASTPAEAASIIKAVANELFKWDAFTLDLYSAEQDRIDPVLNVDTDRAGQRFDIVPSGLGQEPTKMARRIIQQGAELILRQEPLVMPPETTPIGDTTRPSASLALVPIRNRTKVIGILSIQSYTVGAYNAQDLAMLQTLADHCGGALERIRAEQAVHRLEEQLRQSQKMEAIGQLAGGVAHDFNNILTVIHGHASLLQAGGGLTASACRSALSIGQAAERATALTRQLLAFSRRQLMQPRVLEMNEVVSNVTKMLGRLLGEHITLEVQHCSQPAPVQADAGMMEQALLNLAVNARDSMPKGGALTIKISTTQFEARYLENAEARAGRFICLSVADTGCGIPPENLQRIFEPFFTTKQVGKGTGLGLATVYGIVKQHQGWLEVASQVGQGSCFKVFLPMCAAPVETRKSPAESGTVRGGTETILVVEDETPVRELVCNLLAGYGYRVFQAESGLKALELWQACKDDVDLLLTDLVMPDRVNGQELAEKLQAERPNLKVIFTSGYSEEVAGTDWVLRRGLNYLQKPYHPQKLARTVRECLDVVN
jgi:PAS domain S-box-containing protein